MGRGVGRWVGGVGGMGWNPKRSEQLLAGVKVRLRASSS